VKAETRVILCYRSAAACRCRWYLECQQGYDVVSCDLKAVGCHQPLPRCYSL